MAHIALIDDEQLVRESFARLLDSRDHSTECFASSEQFLLAAPALQFDCLIVDFRLPGRNGCELIRELRAQNVLTPVILLSGNVDESVFAQLEGVDGVSILDKPCLSANLFQAVADCTAPDTPPSPTDG